MALSEGLGLNDLIALSRNDSRAARRRLFEDMGSLFLSEEERMTEQERAHISDIMTKLIKEVEMSVRLSLSEKLSDLEEAPEELVTLLANDEIDVARPLLVKSRVLKDPDLLMIIERRSKEHMLAITERDSISPLVSDMLIELGDEDVMEQLIRNNDAEISEEALALLVEESRRVDGFQEPLLARHDLPTELAHKMFWWVSAALRRHIIENFKINPDFLDRQIHRSTQAILDDDSIPEFGETHADRLAAHLEARNDLTERTLIQSLKSNQIRLFLAGLAIKSGLPPQTLGDFVHNRNAESMAVVCKALSFDRNSFSAIFLLTRRGGASTSDGRAAIQPAEVEAVMKFYDNLNVDNAQLVLEHWRMNTGYSEAIDQINGNDNDQMVYL
ncbi:DUF2336 domain-containing protein [Sneathiella sp. P13V-1]|uniref:DUF2336 domain-containing protein n=1 Tax=Sneathiella sp. P13V-1 TaxID=2697366 RepID=UPI00187B828E|nr:DUF2336 domain-containing protein [Sneathiella sp. P13V-1]MBE7637638.1 DUF2336 domain-containing protein [Sneathiella sp. P13V-1]